MIESQETDYLGRILQMSPMKQSTDIIAAHDHFLQPEDSIPHRIDESISPLERRELALQKINALRNCFWSLKEHDLTQQLEEIDVREFPDLSLALSHLRNIAGHRNSFELLEQHPDCFEEFFTQFCNLVVAAPQDASELRTDFLNSSREQAASPKSHGAQDYRQIATVIQQEFPEFEDLEKLSLSQIGLKSEPRKSPKLTLVILQIAVILLSFVTMLMMLYLGVLYSGILKD